MQINHINGTHSGYVDAMLVMERSVPSGLLASRDVNDLADGLQSIPSTAVSLIPADLWQSIIDDTQTCRLIAAIWGLTASTRSILSHAPGSSQRTHCIRGDFPMYNHIDSHSTRTHLTQSLYVDNWEDPAQSRYLHFDTDRGQIANRCNVLQHLLQTEHGRKRIMASVIGGAGTMHVDRSTMVILLCTRWLPALSIRAPLSQPIVTFSTVIDIEASRWGSPARTTLLREILVILAHTRLGLPCTNAKQLVTTIARETPMCTTSRMTNTTPQDGQGLQIHIETTVHEMTYTSAMRLHKLNLIQAVQPFPYKTVLAMMDTRTSSPGLLARSMPDTLSPAAAVESLVQRFAQSAWSPTKAFYAAFQVDHNIHHVLPGPPTNQLNWASPEQFLQLDQQRVAVLGGDPNQGQIQVVLALIAHMQWKHVHVVDYRRRWGRWKDAIAGQGGTLKVLEYGAMGTQLLRRRRLSTVMLVPPDIDAAHQLIGAEVVVVASAHLIHATELVDAFQTVRNIIGIVPDVALRHTCTLRQRCAAVLDNIGLRRIHHNACLAPHVAGVVLQLYSTRLRDPNQVRPVARVETYHVPVGNAHWSRPLRDLLAMHKVMGRPDAAVLERNIELMHRQQTSDLMIELPKMHPDQTKGSLDTCVICTTSTSEIDHDSASLVMVALTCGHTLCLRCAAKIESCPICRSSDMTLHQITTTNHSHRPMQHLMEELCIREVVIITMAGTMDLVVSRVTAADPTAVHESIEDHSFTANETIVCMPPLLAQDMLPYLPAVGLPYSIYNIKPC